MSFNYRTEEYYKKFIELQEKLRKSEEERLKLEMKFNEMVQVTREEEQMHFRKLRSQYKRFLEEDRRRQDRNERILRTLERIENRVAVLMAKSERFKLLRQQYQTFLDRIYKSNQTKSEDFVPKQTHFENPQPTTVQDHQNDIVETYLQKLSSEKLKNLLRKGEENRERLPFSLAPDSSEIKRNYDDLYGFGEEQTRPNYANSIADDIMNSIYSKHKPDTEAWDQNAQLNNNTHFDRFSSKKDQQPISAEIETTKDNLTDCKLLQRNDDDSDKMESSEEEVCVNKFPVKNAKLEDQSSDLPLEMKSPKLENSHEDNNTDKILLDQKSTEIIKNNDFKMERLDETLLVEEIPPSNLVSNDQGPSEIVEEKDAVLEYKIDGQFSQNDTIQPQEVTPKYIEDTKEKVISPTDQVVQDQPTLEETVAEKLDDVQGLNTEELAVEEEQIVIGGSKINEDDEVNLQPIGHNEPIIQQGVNEGEYLSQYEEDNSQQYPVNLQQVEEYDESGQVVQQYDDNQAYQQYDENGQPLYDENGQYLQQYDENGQLLQQYDENGQPYNAEEQYFQQYDENGQPLQQYDQDGQFLQQYDESGQPIPYDYDAQPIEEQLYQQYDENGQIIQQYDNPQQEFDESGQPIQQFYQNDPQYSVETVSQPEDHPDHDGNVEELAPTNEPEGKVDELPRLEASKEDKPDVVEEKITKQVSNVMEMLDTDTESAKQDTKVSNDSDFDFSNG